MKNLMMITVLAGLTLSVQAFAAGEHRKGRASEHSKADKAERQEKRAQKILKKIDTSGDEKIDLSEYLANAEERFNSMDTNADGYVTPEEMRAWSKMNRSKIREARKAKKAERRAASE